MSLPSSQPSLFEQAEQTFDLGRLRCDLEAVGQIDPRDWEFLKGVLCGLDQGEIAKQCSVEKETVKTALSRGISSQIRTLLPGKTKVDWKRLPLWLTDAGYGIGENYRVNWQQICRSMLDRQKKLSTNAVIASEAMQFDLLNDKIFVSLALVECKEPDRLSQNIDPVRSVKRYEEKPPIEYEVFREQVLRRERDDRIAIIGEPGAGKTTLLQHIAFWILEQGLGLPIWISLGDLLKDGDLQRLKDYLTQVWLEDAISNVTQDVKSDFLEQLNEQRLWLLLDGADEIIGSSGITLHELDQQLRGWLQQSCILLTCRLNVWDADVNPLRDFQTYRTKEFHYPAQVERFIENGFCRGNQLSGQRLKTELAKPEQDRLQQLVRNPLRLMMLCATWHEQESLPGTKAELYERFVYEFYKWNKTKWKKKNLNYSFFPTTKANQEKLNQALGRLACCALDEEPSPFRLPHDLVARELGDPDEEGSDFWLALNLGWLQMARDSSNPSEKVYIFFHPTFQEYFAALAIDDWDDFLPRHHGNKPIENRKGECRYRIFESRWKEVILLWLGRSNTPVNKDEFIEKIVDFEDGLRHFYSCQVINLIGEGIKEYLPEDELKEKILAAYKFPIGTDKNEYSKIHKIDEVFLEKIEIEWGKLLPRACTERNILEPAQKLSSSRKFICFLQRLGFNQAQACAFERLENFDSLLKELSHYRYHSNLNGLGPSNVVHNAIRHLRNDKDIETRRAAMKRFLEIVSSNPLDALEVLIKNYQENPSETRYQFEIPKSKLNRRKIDNTNENEKADTRLVLFAWSVKNLLKKDFNDLISVNSLIDLLRNSHDLLRNSQNDALCAQTFLQKLVEIIQGVSSSNLLKSIVKQMRNYLTNEIFINEDFYCDCRLILWKCAEKLSYPDFYQAWHDPMSSSDVELFTNDGGAKS